MMDNELRIKRLLHEAADPQTGLILLDVVLGYGAHPDPAGELAPAIRQAIQAAAAGGRRLEVIAVVVGTDEDPQNLAGQMEQLAAVGAHVEQSNEAATRRAGEIARSLAPVSDLPPVDLAVLHTPLAGLNVGLESFTTSLNTQGAAALHLDWRPPAGGNERLAGILARMKGKG